MSDGTRYKATIFDHTYADGIGMFVITGELEELSGVQLVRAGDLLYPVAGWHESEADALRAVAPRVVEIAERITAQAARLAEGKR
jgi:hypothetical protein